MTQHVTGQVLKGILPDKANGRESVQADRRIFLGMMNYDSINGLPCRIQIRPGRRQGQFFASQQFRYQRVDLISEGLEPWIIVHHGKKQGRQFIFQAAIPVGKT